MVVHTQENDLSHSMVHYLLAIHKLKESKGYARVTDVAKTLELTKGSVSTAINGLKRKGLVMEEPDSKFLALSTEGHQEVHQILSSRTLLYYFLKDFVGVDEETAKKDSCLMEHLMSSKTNEGLFKFMKELTCHCQSNQHKESKVALEVRINQFETSLNLCGFENASQFTEQQLGDSHLSS